MSRVHARTDNMRILQRFLDRCAHSERTYRGFKGTNKPLIIIDIFQLVPGRGLEPPRCYPLVPETSASTNSATRARDGVPRGMGLGERRNLRTGLGAVN